MSAYDNFASVYDILMSDADYEKRSEYILELFKGFDRKPTLLLDVACGTGTFSNLFAETGLEVIGADISEEMLSVARENSAEMGLNVLYLCQSAEELDLYGTVDGAVCLMDSINHITDKNALQKAFSRISLFLEPERLFIFDVNTPFKHKEILGNNTFILDEEGVYCVWQNEYNQNTHETQITLDFFLEDGDRYFRSGEEFCERAYTNDELEKMLTYAGFKIEAVFDDLTQNPPTEKSERLFYICRKNLP